MPHSAWESLKKTQARQLNQCARLVFPQPASRDGSDHGKESGTIGGAVKRMQPSRASPFFHLAGLSIIAIACCLIAWLQYDRRQVEINQARGLREAARKSLAYQAWRQAASWDSLRADLASSNALPKDRGYGYDREVWVKSYERSDVQSTPALAKYGNSSYAVSLILEFHDAINSLGIANMSSAQMKKETGNYWAFASAHCQVDELDSGEWIASACTFATLPSVRNFPAERIKSTR
jgi:hypothetical protein